jgi:hypothetical protein
MSYTAPEAGAFAKKSGTLSEKITYELGLIEDEQPTGDVVGTTDMTNFVDFDAASGCVSTDTGTPGAASTHKIKIDIGGTAGYIAVYADY